MSTASPLTVGVPKETYAGERRVALIPASIAALKKAGMNVVVEASAGLEAGFTDDEYLATGAQVASRDEVFSTANILFQVRTAGANKAVGQADMGRYRAGQWLIGLCDPFSEPALMAELAGLQVSCFALELLPRITRAQSMDVLSSMASIAGYKSVIMAAEMLPRLFPMMMTAAGTIAPAKVFVMGVGVAGLQAIATARRLGAVVKAYDIRPAVKDEVLSLGAKFVELDLKTDNAAGAGGYAKAMDEEFYRRQRELLTQVVGESDVVITTAAVPGKKAPMLVTADMVRKMPKRAILIDLAAEQGGNCELTRAGETVVENGVSIVGCVNLPSTVPFHASQMYAKNLSTFLLSQMKSGEIALNLQDELVSNTLVTHEGQVVHPKIREILGLGPLPPEPPARTTMPLYEGTP
ncbi:MAG TPA: Re/Si-specific NAD(P)(+) transhydrogenase subunit alpha [Schlesneria sp.]|jgi:NAD(P) transhydrogenase subunit alpha